MDTLIKVDGLAWTGLGVKYDTPPQTSLEMVEGANLNWTVNHEEMYTETHGKIPGWHTIYREDNNKILGVIHKDHITHVQNIDCFSAMEPILSDGRAKVDTSASFGNLDTVFGCFELTAEYKLLDDELRHYFVVMNEHLKPDGKVTVLNTPVRVICQNALSAALSKNLYKLRVPVSSELGVNRHTASHIIMEAENAIKQLKSKAEKMATQKISKEGIEKLLDTLFPYSPKDSLDIAAAKQNEQVEMTRMTFINDCLGAENLQNYRGTHFAVFNALTDFSQHYYKKVDTGYDLNHRMKTLPGIASDGPAMMVQKFLSVAKTLVAA